MGWPNERRGERTDGRNFVCACTGLVVISAAKAHRVLQVDHNKLHADSFCERLHVHGS